MTIVDTLKRLGRSTVFWCVLCLVGFEVLALAVQPIKFIRTTRYVPIEANPLASKLPAFLRSNAKPDVVVLGSSLPMEAIAHLDTQLAGEPGESLDSVRSYTRARYLEDSIAKLSGRKVSVANLTCVACMASDALFILQRTIAANKTPKIVIYGIAPRDFIDNLAAPVGKSPACQALSPWKTLSDVLAEGADLPNIVDFCLGSLSSIYRTKTDYKKMLTGALCDASGHPADLYEYVQLDRLREHESEAANVGQTAAKAKATQEAAPEKASAKETTTAPPAQIAQKTTTAPPGKDEAKKQALPVKMARETTTAPPAQIAQNTTTAPPAQIAQNTTTAPPGKDQATSVSKSPRVSTSQAALSAVPSHDTTGRVGSGTRLGGTGSAPKSSTRTTVAAKKYSGGQFWDLPEWNSRYNPPNDKRFTIECDRLERLAELCRKQGIKLAIVNMPLTDENKALLPKRLYAEYKHHVLRIVKAHAATFVDLDASGKFQLSDFYDSAHTNAEGGKKVQDGMLSAVINGKLL